jgi:galactitol-specific phosphotransferase system IIC component
VFENCLVSDTKIYRIGTLKARTIAVFKAVLTSRGNVIYHLSSMCIMTAARLYIKTAVNVGNYTNNGWGKYGMVKRRDANALRLYI